MITGDNATQHLNNYQEAQTLFTLVNDNQIEQFNNTIEFEYNCVVAKSGRTTYNEYYETTSLKKIIYMIGKFQNIPGQKMSYIKTFKLCIDAWISLSKKFQNEKILEFFILAFHDAMKLNDQNLIDIILEKVPSVLAEIKNDEQFLFDIIKKGLDQVLQKLVDLKVDLNIKNQFNKSLLEYAFENEAVKMANILVSSDVLDLNIHDEKGGTYLHYFVRYLAKHSGEFAKWENTIEKLIMNKNLDLHAKDNQGQTALEIARYYKMDPLSSLLKKHMITKEAQSPRPFRGDHDKIESPRSRNL